MQSSNSDHFNMSNPYSPASTIYSPSPDSVSSATSNREHTAITSQPSQTRQRLRPWLIDQINSGKTPGLEWIDPEKMIFKIPWKHFGRPGVDEYNDAMLFRNWAIHTKKYQEGQPPDISTWKTRFRCALYKLPDINELNNMNVIEGDNPYRVYQFVKKDGESNGAIANTPMALPLGMNPVVLSPAQSNFSGITDDGVSFGAQSSTDLNLHGDRILEDDLSLLPYIEENDDLDFVNPFRNEVGMNQFSNMQSNMSPNHMMNQPAVMQDLGSPQQPQPQLSPQQPQPQQRPPQQQQQQQLNQTSQIKLLVKMFYADQEVYHQNVDNPKGLRIAFDPPPPLPDDIIHDETTQVVSHIFGPFQAEQIYFPNTNDANTMELLKCIRRGLVLQARNGEILATRLCRAKVFYSDSVSPANVKTLPREHTMVVFDYLNDFLPKLQAYMLGQGPLPTCELFFSFAQKWSQESPLKNNYIYVNVIHCLAKEQVSLLQSQKAEVLVSDPNMLDVIAKQIEDLRVNNLPNSS